MSEIYNSTTLRRELHPMAEIGLETRNTAQYVLEHLKAIGIDAKKLGDTNVVLGVIDSGMPGEVVMLRADMDALPFIVDGKKVAVHACGHDGHTAMLLEAASRLVGKIRHGKLKLLFQPAEEIMEGALQALGQGALDDVDIVIGAHIRPVQDIPVGTMCPAVVHGSSWPVSVYVKGRTAHASRPHLGVNVIAVGASIVNAVAHIYENPNNSWSIKTTRFVADEGAHNIIPDKLMMGFDIRAQTNEMMQDLHEKLARIAKSTAEAYGAAADVVVETGCPAANLDDDVKAELAECIKETVGEENLAKDCGGGGEDFHYFKYKKPGIKNGYFGVGVGATPGLHKVNMTFDDTLLPKGAEVFVRYALRHLG